MFKKIFISQMIKIKVEEKKPGKIIFKMNSLKQAKEEYFKYEKFLHQALNKLDGINEIKVSQNDGTISVKYDEKILNESKLLRWVEILKEVGVENYDLIEKYGENDLELVVDKIDKQLNEKLKKM